MFFRNLKLFRLAGEWPDDIGESLARIPLVPCGASTMYSSGWIPPRGNPGEYVVSVAGHQLIRLGVEEKLLPASVVRIYVEDRLKDLEEKQGFKPGRGQVRETREAVTAELIPKAFIKRRSTHVWIDTNGRWLGIDAASFGKVDEILESIKRTFGLMPLLTLNTMDAPSSAMTQWLTTGEAPGAITIDRDCELRSPAEEHATVKYTRHSLDGEDIRPHLEDGKRAVRLAMTWNNRISFVLTEDYFIKRLAFLDLLKDQAEEDSEVDAFEADLSIMSGELSLMADGILSALRGEYRHET